MVHASAASIGEQPVLRRAKPQIRRAVGQQDRQRVRELLRWVLQVLEEAVAANYPVLISSQDDHTLPTRFGDRDRNRALVLLRRNQRRPSDQP